ncbi:MAG: DUF4381 family protein, partial [Candidatus Omnitrophica bacterium]|nr:DUF4381 family protein [Candidatus Omnitrophota bacterium]
MKPCRKMGVLVLTLWGVLAMAHPTGAKEDGLRDIRGPVLYPIDPLFVAVLCAVMAAGGVVLVRLLWRQLIKRRAVQRQKPPLPPWEIALKLLEDLKKKKYVEYNKYQQFYSELSDILRRYMENHFCIRAPEMTTEEFLESIKNYESVAEEHKINLKRFLQHADVVKFAKVSPSTEEAEQSYELAKRFI